MFYINSNNITKKDVKDWEKWKRLNCKADRQC